VVDGKEERALAVYWVTGGVDRCKSLPTTTTVQKPIAMEVLSRLYLLKPRALYNQKEM
jgi:hypothetical protein